MPRRGNVSKRDVLPDPLYNSKLVTKLINNVMEDGKKGVAQKIVYDAFSTIEEKLGQNPLEVFNEALENVMPVLEVKARRVGGSTYQVPMEVRAERRQTLGRKEQHGWRIQEKRRDPQNGGSQQGFRALQILMRCLDNGKTVSA